MRITLLLTLSIAGSCVPDAPGTTLSAMAAPKDAFDHAVAQLRIIGNEEGAYDRGRFRYYSRKNDDGARVFARCSLERGDEQVLLDERDVDGSFGALLVSPDERFVAFSSGITDRYALRVKEIASGETVAPVVKGVDFSFAWSKDNHVIYTRLDEKNRPTRVFSLQPKSRHLPRLVHEERTNEVLVAPGPALFVRTSSDVLAYRLNPLYYADGELYGFPSDDSHVDDAAPVDAGPALCGVGAVSASRGAP
jgi:hypothetical protein